MDSDLHQRRIAGALNATHTVIAILVDDLAAANITNKAVLVGRLTNLVEAMRQYPGDPEINLGAATAFKTIGAMISAEPKGDAPRWTPEIIPGGKDTEDGKV